MGSRRRGPKGRNRRPSGRKEKRGNRKSRGGGQGRGSPKTPRKGRAQAPSRGTERTSNRGRTRGSFSPRGRKRSQRADGGGLKSVQGRIDKNRRGFAFLIFDSRDLEDVFLPPRHARSLFHGDRVAVQLSGSDKIVGVRVIEHRFRELVGRFRQESQKRQKYNRHRGGYVYFEQKNFAQEIPLPRGAKGAREEDWIRVRLNFTPEGADPVTGELAEVYGKELPARVDIAMVAGEFGLQEHHSKEANAEAKAKKLNLDQALREREDFRKIPFITIDGETARDFDDAVYVEKQANQFILWVGIADVSHYVTPGSTIDKEGYARATSVYFPERAFHMIPSALSENLCSLRPKEARLSMVAKIFFSFSGTRERVEIYNAVIESKRRATYKEIQGEYLNHRKDPQWEYAVHFELYRLLKQTRLDRGAIDFDLPEGTVKVDENTGEPQRIYVEERLDSHRLIEEFMIAANEATTDWMQKRKRPFVYRIHEIPTETALDEFRTLARTVGVEFPRKVNPLNPKPIAKFLRTIKGHQAELLLNTALLRSMKQAIYTAEPGHHYGLGSQGYTHFTSPIRRYPDLMVHRLLKAALAEKGQQMSPQMAGDQSAKLEEQCQHCSYRERLAEQAERESVKIKQVRMLTRHLGEEFEGTIIGMIEKGMFVQVRDPFFEGMIAAENLKGDDFQFISDKMIFSGRRTRQKYRIGDTVRIQVANTDLVRRTIDLELVE